MRVGEIFSEVEGLSDYLLLSFFHSCISAEHGPQLRSRHEAAKDRAKTRI